MNYIKEAENILRHYEDLCASIENMKERRAILIARAGPKELKAVNLEDVKGGNSKVKDSTLNILYEIKKLSESIKSSTAEIKRIDGILEEISGGPDCKYYGWVLRKWYIEKVPKEDITKELRYSSRQSVYNIKHEAIRKFAVRMFGIEALKTI